MQGRYKSRWGAALSKSIVRQAVESLEPRRLLTTYYVSPTGADSNAGTSATAAWATVAKVDATLYQPGDQILFQSGGEWHGLLTASSSGSTTNPITYSTYGGSNKAIFDGSDIIPASAFSPVAGSTYSFNVSAVSNSNGNAYWVYANHTGMLAAGASDASSTGVQANANSFFVSGSTVYINTGGTNPNTNGVVYTLGDRGAGTNTDSSLINSNAKSNLVFQNLLGRETAEVGSGNQLGGGINDGYVYRVQGGSNVSLLNDEGDYGSKHIVGAIDTTGFIANGLLLQGAPEGVNGNGLPYGNATATVAYSDNDSGDTSQWINVTVQNYDGGQPAFLTHGNDNAIKSILLQNFVSLGSPIALEPGAGYQISIIGGEITNNTLTAYSDTGVVETINGMTFTGTGSAVEIYGNATVENCLFVNSAQSNQAIQTSGANNLIRFNTIIPPSYGTAIALESGETGANIYGNLFSGSSNDISVAGGDTYTADYNFFDSTAGTPHFGAAEPNAVTANPQFNNSSGGDYSLKSTSPAINIIPTTAVTPALTTDLRGFTRPSANVYDAGAYEFQSVLHQPTIATAAAANPSPVTGTSTALSVLGASQDGEATLTYTWSTTGSPPATVTFSANGTNAAKNTTATFTAAGNYNFSVNVSNGQYSVSSVVAVTVNQTSQGITISPTQFFVPINTTKQFTAAVVDQFNNPINSATVSYSIQSGNGSINGSTGLFTAPATTGTTIIKATSGNSSTTATANVVPPDQAPTVATAASASPNPVTSTTSTLAVLGADDNGEANLTYTWSLTGTPPAAVNFSVNGTNAAKTTVATFTANGSYNFLVTITDENGLSTTSATTVNVSIFVPIVIDGTLDGRYGSPLAVQTQVTDLGLNSLQTNPTAPYSQLSAIYGIIDQTSGQFDLFMAGSLDLLNAHLDLFIDSVPGAGAANTSALATANGPWNASGNGGFSSITFDSGFRPDHLFTSTFGGGYSLSYYNFDSNTEINNNLTDPATGTATSSGGVPYFQEKVDNTQENNLIAANAGGSITTGAEWAFSLSGLGYTSADYSAGDPINVMAMLSYGSHTEASNQTLPANSTIGYGSYLYYGSNFDFTSNATFPGNQYVTVNVPSAPAGPTIATSATASPNPVTSGNTTDLAVLGADSSGESTLRYTWTTTGNQPAPVNFSLNGTNAAKSTIATFTANGTYNFLVTVTDNANLTTTSTVTVDVTGITVVTGPVITSPASAGSTGVNGTSTTLAVSAAENSTTLTYTWTETSNPSNVPPPTYSANGTTAAANTTARFYQAGIYNFTVTVTDTAGNSATSSVVVTVNQTITTLSLTPPILLLIGNASQQLYVTAKDQFSNAIAVPSVTWSASGGAIISSSGVFAANQPAGNYTVTASGGVKTATANVTVTGPGTDTQTDEDLTQSPLELTNIGSGDLIIPAAGDADLTETELLIQRGAHFSAGYFNGHYGITSSAAASDTSMLTAVGVLLNNNGDANNPQPIYTTFGGVTTGLNDVLVKYTYFGDANLDGKVDGSDYSRIDSGYLTGATDWQDGDFNYDGVVNGSDYTLIDNAFNRQGPAINASLITKVETVQGSVHTAVAMVATPNTATFSNKRIASVAHEIFDGASGDLLG